MGTYKFDMAEVAPLVAHAQAAPKHGKVYGGKPKAALWLVKDQGVYLMSSGIPRMPKADGSEGSHVVYAEGFDPEKAQFDDWWEGGDDYVEALPLAWFMQALASGARQFTLSVSEQGIRISYRPAREGQTA
jgi:hypothetical protein